MLLKHTINGALCEVDDETGEQLLESGAFLLEDIPPGATNPVLGVDEPEPAPEIPVLTDDESEAPADESEVEDPEYQQE